MRRLPQTRPPPESHRHNYITQQKLVKRSASLTRLQSLYRLQSYSMWAHVKMWMPNPFATVMGQLDHRPATRMAWKQEFLGCKRQTEPIGSLYTAKSAVMREMDHVARVFSHESARSTAHDPWLYRFQEKETLREKDLKQNTKKFQASIW